MPVIENHAPNSFKSKEEAKKTAVIENKSMKDKAELLTPVVSGATSVKKKGPLDKVAKALFASDVESIKKYAIEQVVIPTIKQAINSLVSNGISILLWGSPTNQAKNGSTRVSYGSYWNNGQPQFGQPVPQRRAGFDAFDFDSVVFDFKNDADAVLSRMDEIIANYNFVTVGNFYDLAHVSCSNFQVENYGWKDIRSAYVASTYNGKFVIKFPPAYPIDR